MQKNRGKNTDDDLLFGSEKQTGKLKMAVQDMHYLLSRGYAERASSELTGNRYRLKARQIQAVRAASASEIQIRNRADKALQISALQDATVHLDGFNIIILLESLLSGAYIFRGADGCLRDLSGVHGTYRKVNQTLKSIELVAAFFQKSGARKLIWIFDKPVSNSGRIRQMVLDFSFENHLNWETELEFNPDRFLAEHAEIAVSSDGWILDHCRNWFNLAGYLMEEEKLPVNLVKMV
ncbi:DUF434 domain-containing protein [Chryseobacterium sp. JJR-5R]|uniref:DUF434 domain-containing protein n=1 Tax=Chryseobacterium sp. JJR-5R TaxID=3093923 RepID=UPI002A766337|nr:DUF434 domain-containing protein [Chryseobacterium sp. JJR-5R]WPO83462.1 DUF434 domain-containing protein [Chryseobacterium sp. JJR-5R]